MSRRVRSVIDSSVSPIAAAVAGTLRSSSTAAAAWRRMSLLGVSAILLPAFACGQDAAGAGANKSDGEDVDTVIVTGVRREAMDKAVDRKKNAESIADSIVADEAGMLPDNSLTEVLQRVPGVTMSRFLDADHTSTEGNGIQVRGMSGVAARLNG